MWEKGACILNVRRKGEEEEEEEEEEEVSGKNSRL
jgi:hypothetical protein